MKRYRTYSGAAVLAVAAGVAAPAMAQVYDSRMDNRAVAEVSSFGPPAPDAFHSGANNPADEALADSVAAALAADPRLDGATVTVAANNGRVSLSGSARTAEQAGHAENIARGIAGVTAVSGTLDSQGG